MDANPRARQTADPSHCSTVRSQADDEPAEMPAAPGVETGRASATFRFSAAELARPSPGKDPAGPR
jgi:hypothetical protein